jgi:hypothetical protein
MYRCLALLAGCAAVSSSLSFAQDSSALAALRAACGSDAQKFCAGVPPGGGRVIACLVQHKDSLSDQCKQVAARVANPANGSATTPSGATPAATAPAAAASVNASGAASSSNATSASPASAASSASRGTAGSGANLTHASPAGSSVVKATEATSKSYLRMKQVQVIAHVNDPVLGKGLVDTPVEDVLIPSTWDFKGSVAANTNEGCYSDIFAVSLEAKSPDGTMVFQGAPNYSWQYTDDPAALRKLTDPNRRQLGVGGKPCPVSKPLNAEDYLRQQMLPQLPSGSTVIAVEQFPELNRIARLQLGLPAEGSSARDGTQTEAIRARFEGQKDGKPVESWITLVVVTRQFPQGRGAFYDCHAIDVMAFVAPKGKLDGNDKLFKVMMSSIRPEPKWQSYSGGFIAKLYQAEAQKEAAIDSTIANFQNYVAQTINGVTARAQQGANNAAFGEDQIVRSVQTFRDPTTGKTMELSNLYDHAWLNSSNEYIMSDDPNFNPNGQLTGNWNQLQPVRPSP